eukprot:CAMPEP_0182836000 /NCGR_PEP_ID=MMETSP0006_2-20121128/21839_1 /TAXON_ID=97485 /ORGANISM="Prymnesium parvum, Strain Texoma1" /LENGTH=61 /DNA_ID=CAMNT_0024964533 /DNA_START=355 /DNA_END=537 /DNA_ORIENTATION=+
MDNATVAREVKYMAESVHVHRARCCSTPVWAVLRLRQVNDCRGEAGGVRAKQNILARLSQI